jgi:hypothetical protein
MHFTCPNFYAGLNVNQDSGDSSFHAKDKEAIKSIDTHTHPYDIWHDEYQAYYREGLAAYAFSHHIAFRNRPLTRLPRFMRLSNRTLLSTRMSMETL